MPDIETHGPPYDVEPVKHWYWPSVAIEAWQRTWDRVFANTWQTVLTGIAIIAIGIAITYYTVGPDEAWVALHGVWITAASGCTAWALLWIFYMLRIPPKRAAVQESTINDLRTSAATSVLLIACGEFQGDTHELLFRIRVSAQSLASIEQLECKIYEVVSLESRDAVLQNRLKNMVNRPLERMHFYRKYQAIHDVAAGDAADYDLILQDASSGNWMLRFAMDHIYEEQIPHGRYRIAVRARALGFKEAIGHFDIWEDSNGRLCFNETGYETSVGADLVAAIDRQQSDGECPALPQPKNSSTDHEAEMRELERETAIIKQNAALHEAARNFEALMRSRADRQ